MFRKKVEKKARKHCSSYLTAAHSFSVDRKQPILTVFLVKYIVVH